MNKRYRKKKREWENKKEKEDEEYKLGEIRFWIQEREKKKKLFVSNCTETHWICTKSTVFTPCYKEEEKREDDEEEEEDEDDEAKKRKIVVAKQEVFQHTQKWKWDDNNEQKAFWEYEYKK